MEPQLPDDPDGFENDPPRKLGAAVPSILEGNRDLDDSGAKPVRPIGGLNLEGVAVRPDAAEVERGKGFPPPAFEARREIMVLQAEDPLRVAGAGAAEQPAKQGPAAGRTAGAVAGAHHEIRT